MIHINLKSVLWDLKLIYVQWMNKYIIQWISEWFIVKAVSTEHRLPLLLEYTTHNVYLIA